MSEQWTTISAPYSDHEGKLRHLMFCAKGTEAEVTERAQKDDSLWVRTQVKHARPAAEDEIAKAKATGIDGIMWAEPR